MVKQGVVVKQAGISLNLLRVQELCESRGGRPGLPVLTSLTVSVCVLTHWSQFVPNMSTRHPRTLRSTPSSSLNLTVVAVDSTGMSFTPIICCG